MNNSLSLTIYLSLNNYLSLSNALCNAFQNLEVNLGTLSDTMLVGMKILTNLNVLKIVFTWRKWTDLVYLSIITHIKACLDWVREKSTTKFIGILSDFHSQRVAAYLRIFGVQSLLFGILSIWQQIVVSFSISSHQ